jgi:hypothetical protein
MKRLVWMVVVGCLFVVPELAQAQVDKMIDRFFQRGDQRGEGRVQPGDLKVAQLEVSPDVIREGRWVSFRVVVVNESRRSGRISLVVRDRDEVITEVRDVDIHPGENRVDFPESYYRFSRSDTCFTVEADIEHNRRPLEAAKEFCLRRTLAGWTMSDRRIGYLYVEDLDMYPDPAMPGQEVRFRVRLRNDGRSIRGSVRI